MTNLEKAKELKYKIKNIKINLKHYPENKIGLEIQINKAKQLKEEVEKGCSKDYCPSCNKYKYDEYSFKCGRWELLTLINF